jgi:hypothetical protein
MVLDFVFQVLQGENVHVGFVKKNNWFYFAICLSMAFEVCMRGQMVEYFMLNNLLDPLQSLFNGNHMSMITVGLLILSVALF